MNRRLCGEKKACPLHTADLERLGGRAEAVPARVGGPVLRRPGVAGEVLEQEEERELAEEMRELVEEGEAADEIWSFEERMRAGEGSEGSEEESEWW